MDVLGIGLTGLALYLYFEVWTIRICLRYSAWWILPVLAVDHLIGWLSVTHLPMAFLVWKTWFIWTASRMEPVRGMLTASAPPLLRMDGETPRIQGRAAITISIVNVVMLLLAYAIAGEGAASVAGMILGLWVIQLTAILIAWIVSTVRRTRRVIRTYQEPAPWVAGPNTH